ncbi:hypothetical protein EGT07_13275 [Herbaspirillum sp. HC18]|nr:hypothetical protein EGT07_13275 [Herbaspirillum sp. HC18]
MRDIQKMNRLLDELASRYDIPNLAMPAHGAVGLRLKDGSELFLEHDESTGMLYAYMPVMPLPKDDALRSRLFARMLEMNFLGMESERTVLSVQRENATCHASFVIADLQFEAFDCGLQRLIAARSGLAGKLNAEALFEPVRTSKERYVSTALLASLRQ